MFAAVWEVTGRFIITGRYAFAPLSVVLVETVKQFADGTIYIHLLTSGYELGVGFGLAAIVGIVMGILIGVSQPASDYFLPLIYAANATPIVALAPLFILLLGVGAASKIIVIFLLCYFAVLVNTVAGVRTVDRSLVEAARAFCANRTQIVWMVLLPNAVPFIIAGLRTALGRGLVGVIVAELYGASAGLGWLAWSASERMNAKLLFVAVTILAVTGVVCTLALDVLERRIAPWRRPPSEAE
ncbi:MAG TPA: ABC transporter permease [Candidatus Binatia bacterium]|nr:ABC transporter permease [Candidatus Binatia bacterium]